MYQIDQIIFPNLLNPLFYTFPALKQNILIIFYHFLEKTEMDYKILKTLIIYFNFEWFLLLIGYLTQTDLILSSFSSFQSPLHPQTRLSIKPIISFKDSRGPSSFCAKEVPCGLDLCGFYLIFKVNVSKLVGHYLLFDVIWIVKLNVAANLSLQVIPLHNTFLSGMYVSVLQSKSSHFNGGLCWLSALSSSFLSHFTTRSCNEC